MTLHLQLEDAVCASADPYVYQYALEHLGEGVPPDHLDLLVDTRARLELRLLLLYREYRDPTVLDRATKLREALLQKKLLPNERPQLALDKQDLDMFRKILKRQSERQSEQQEALQRLIAQVAKDDEKALAEKMRDPQALVRLLATQAVERRRLHFEQSLIERLLDEDAQVRAAARAALVRLTRGVDHGPAANATEKQRYQAVSAWQSWLAQQDPAPTAEAAGPPGPPVLQDWPLAAPTGRDDAGVGGGR